MKQGGLKKDGRRVVVLGGGNGTSRLLAALLPLFQAGKLASLHALVHMADDGGSTGRLREQYGVAGAGDLTSCLLALSGLQGDIRGDAFLQSLQYRFAKGEVAGHTLRNLFFTALQKTSDIDGALATMARVLQVPKYTGAVPTTLMPLTEQVAITIRGATSVLGEGEHSIAHQVNLQADPRWQPGDVRVVFAERRVRLNPRARDLLREATDIIVAPGHTFGTILPTLALPALGRAVARSQAPITIVMTLLTTPRQTVGWSGEDFVAVYESYLGRQPGAVIANTGTARVTLVPGQDWVRFRSRRHPYRLIGRPMVSAELPRPQAKDTVPRAVVIHDTKRLQTVFRELLTS